MQDLVSLSAFPKSGVTYLSFLLFYSFFPDSCDIHELERKYILDIHAYPNATFAEPRAPRLIKTHFPYHPAIPSVRLSSKAIYLIRHPIDVMMSVWDFDQLFFGVDHSTNSPEFRAYVQRWLASGGGDHPEYGSWATHVRSWLDQSAIPVHLVSYENLVDAPDRELKSILDFLGVEVSATRQQLAINRSSMKSMAALESQEVEEGLDGIFFRKHLAKGYGQGHRFVNKGYRNSYEKFLTAEERAIADRAFGPELARARRIQRRRVRDHRAQRV